MRMACGEAKRTEAASKFLETASTLAWGVYSGQRHFPFPHWRGSFHTWLSEKNFDNSSEMRYNGPATRSDSRGGEAERPPVRKVRAPQGKDNG